MRNGKYISAERGTLLVEAIAMLGLIALVTPTLYQKSAERLQEIQDINTASQARTMNTIIETFVKANFSEMLVTASSVANETIELIYNDDGVGCQSGSVCYHKGYSAYVPFGYSPGNLKNYGSPRVYVHHDRATGKDTLMSYVVYPTDIDVGKKRAARIASLVGANGGTMTTPFTGGSSLEVFGTGGAWYLDNSSITNEVGIDPELMVDNSLVIASTEPITMSDMDSEKFLYRVPPDDDGKAFHNQMVTDLYMGGHADETAWADHAQEKFYSIFNVRKLTLNTRCTRSHIGPGGSSNADCDDRIQTVADLYIGKPTLAGFDSANVTYSPGVGDHNTGAAWFYGNLSALNQSFHLHRDSSDTSWDRQSGFDVLDFARVDEENPDSVELSVLQATNEEDKAQVSMLDGFVVTREASSGVDYEFMVGRKTSSSDAGKFENDGSWIHALNEGSLHTLRLNSPDELDGLNPEDMETWINAKGGVVHINGGSSDADYKMDTLINDQGGNLEAGKDAGWIKAVNRDTSAAVYLLNGKDMNSSGVNGMGDQRIFAVGTDDKSGNYMIYGEGGRRVALRGGQVRVYNYTSTSLDSSATGVEGGTTFVKDYLEDVNLGGTGDSVPQTLTGATAILSRYTDILGSTYMGSRAMSSGVPEEGAVYTRGGWTLGVAGNAWIDDLLWANEAWFNSAAMRELHAGFSSFADYKAYPRAGWLNAYSDSVIIRNPALAKAGGHADLKGSDSSDVMFLVDSSRVFMKVQNDGSWGELTDNGARFGTKHNRFWAEEDASSGVSSANLAGSSLVNIYTDTTGAGESSVVNIQKDAMIFSGHAFTESSFIDARTGDFRLHTTDDGTDAESAQMYADSSQIRTRYVDFSVENNDSAAVFKVMPNLNHDDSSDANVLVNGRFHVTGNEVIHVASNSYNRAEEGKEDHAMFEVDPEYVQVWAKEGSASGNFAKTGGNTEHDYYALVKINPYDVSGSSTSGADPNASVYIRRGAIELEQSTSSTVDGGWAADEGFGYIMANRMVSNAEGIDVPQGMSYSGNTPDHFYDKYMVNPAYTSVMHDIKLTTRGGARLSDILPDYVLKGVYNLINNCEEGETSGTRCEYQGTDKWADPYIGILPYAKCPPGYKNMATVVPISFTMGQAGQLVKENGRYTVSGVRQADVLNRTGSSMAGVGDNIVYPGYEDVSTVVYNEIYSSDHTFSSFVSHTYSRSEGWFLGFPTIYNDSSWTDRRSNFEADGTGWKYDDGDSGFMQVAMPLYFQQNTWLKTTVSPEGSGGQGWRAYMGFLYDRSYWAEETLGGITAAVKSNFNEEPNGENNLSDTYVWNLFPVPTNTLEGHATVYCYFDRSTMRGQSGWSDLIEPVDQLNDYHAASSVTSNEPYRKRLNDPTLRYDDPW